MSEVSVFNYLILSWFLLALVIFISLFFITAPYGRYTRDNWGPTFNGKGGMLIMEAVAPLTFVVFFFLGSNPISVTSVFFLIMWEAHYIHRAFIYPFSLRGRAKRMTAIVVVLGFIFNSANGYLNGRYIFTLSDGYTSQWLGDPRFIIGLGLFIAGFVINRRADLILHNLRKPDDSDYRIPYGEMYRWISCPNYLGEIVVWIGWAMATWSLAGLAFAIWTMANLVPRAKAHHTWYRSHFANYPTERKILVPGLW